MTDHTDHPPLTDEELAYNRWASEGQPELTDEEFEAAPLLSRYGKESEVRRLCLRLIADLRAIRAEVESAYRAGYAKGYERGRQDA